MKHAKRVHGDGSGATVKNQTENSESELQRLSILIAESLEDEIKAARGAKLKSRLAEISHNFAKLIEGYLFPVGAAPVVEGPSAKPTIETIMAEGKASASTLRGMGLDPYALRALDSVINKASSTLILLAEALGKESGGKGQWWGWHEAGLWGIAHGQAEELQRAYDAMHKLYHAERKLAGAGKGGAR